MRFRFKVIIALFVAIILGYGLMNLLNMFNKNILSGELEVLVNNSNYEYIKEVSERFEKENPKVKIQIKSCENKDYDKRLKEVVEGDEIPDIALANSKEIDYLIKKDKRLSDFTDVIKTYKMNFPKRGLQGVNKGGIYRGIPLESYPLSLYLREDLLKEYGYTYSDINTWDDLINMGKEVYKKSKGKIKALNGTNTDYYYLLSLINMQNIDKYKDIKKAKEETDKFIEMLKKENILNVDGKSGFIGRVNSIDVVNEIRNLNADCNWTANNAPATTVGGNRFYVENGYNLIAFEKDWKKNKVSKAFMVYLTNDTESSLKYTLEGDILSSYLYTYKNSSIENPIKNFKEKSPFIILSNILEKAPEIIEVKESES